MKRLHRINRARRLNAHGPWLAGMAVLICAVGARAQSIPIQDWDDLAKIGDPSHVATHPVNGSYILMADLDSGSGGYRANWTPICPDVGAPFTGTFDGNHKVIRDLVITNGPGTSAYGLFGVVYGATFQNLGIGGGEVFFSGGGSRLKTVTTGPVSVMRIMSARAV